MRMVFSAMDAEIAKAMERELETANATVNGPTKVNNSTQNALEYRRDRIITRAGGEIYSMAPFTNLFGSIRSSVEAIKALW